MTNLEDTPLSSSVNSHHDKSTTNTTLPGSMPPILTSFNISHLFTTLMDKNNYLSWRSQFMDVLELHDLEDLITYDTRPPKKHADGTPNPAYSKDKLVLSWIKATASSTIKTLLIPCIMSQEA
ncbi:unnamed protein product, partial [Prunus brigantina]